MVDGPAWRVSSYTGGSGSCVEVATWRVATYTGSSGDCVEVGDADKTILIRDSKDRSGGMITFTAATWESFTKSLK